MKRPHLEVNLGELDQLLDQATSAPMTAPDSAKVKTALHALAERLLARGRSSEKTRNVVPPPEPEAPPTSTETEEAAAAPRKPGHGRIPAEDYVAAKRQKVKRAVLHRKNALFYKSLNGAAVGDLFMSLIHPCALNDVNPSDYLVASLRNPQAVEAAPGRWMPWNFREAQSS